MSFLNLSPTTIVRRAMSITVTTAPTALFAVGSSLIGKNDLYVQSAQQTGAMSWLATLDQVNGIVANEIIAANVLAYSNAQPGSVTFQIGAADPFVTIAIANNGTGTISTSGGSQVINVILYSQNLFGSLT